MNSDEAHYVWKAERISKDLTVLASEQAWRRHPPLIPLVVGLLAKLMLLETAFLVTTKALAILGLVLVYVLGQRLKGPVAGLVAAVLLASDPTFRILSNKLLLDIPLTILFILCSYFLVQGGVYRIWAVGFGIVAMLVKDYGILALGYVLTAIVCDILLGRGWRLVRVVSAILAPTTFILALSGYYLDYWIKADGFSGTMSAILLQAKLNLYHLVDNSVGWMVPGIQKRYLVIFIILVSPLVFKLLSYLPIRERFLLFLWIAIVFGPLLATYAVEERVMLLFMPAIYVTVGICIAQSMRLLENSHLHNGVLSVTLVACTMVLLMAQKVPEVLYYTHCRFRAYHPTGEWIRHEIARSDVIVFTRSSHQLRFYSGSEHERDGGVFYGQNEFTGVPWTVQEFRRVLDSSKKAAVLVVDIEEKAGPGWLYPPDRAAADTIRAMGFSIVHTVWLPVDTRGNCELPAWNYYSQLPNFLESLGVPLYRDNHGAREMIGAIVFRWDAASGVATSGHHRPGT